MQISIPFANRLLIIVGNTVTAVGCVGLLLGTAGVVSTDAFAIGLSSGVRVIGSVAIAGCLLSAVGYAYEEHRIGRQD